MNSNGFRKDHDRDLLRLTVQWLFDHCTAPSDAFVESLARLEKCPTDVGFWRTAKLFAPTVVAPVVATAAEFAHFTYTRYVPDSMGYLREVNRTAFAAKSRELGLTLVESLT